MKKNQKRTVYVVHCVDVEGPMTETLEATWGRIQEEDGIVMPVPPSPENLVKLQKHELDLGLDKETLDYLARKYSPYNLGYLQDWPAIDRSIEKTLSPNFRKHHHDREGGEYTFSWFIYDHYGFTTNPRLHDDGVHKIFDHYRDLFLRHRSSNDGIYWHHHTVPSSGDALEWCTNWHMNNIHEEILARRIIERRWFPSVFRAGGHIERNDLSHWLEMFIPFDYSGRTPHEGRVYEEYRGRVADWRFAPTEWGCWHPDWYDYRRTGSMRRRIFRCLDLKTWIISLTKRDVRQAFEQARHRGSSILAYYNHDYRDMSTDISHGYHLLKEVEKEFPDVTWRFMNALDAAKAFIGLDEDKAPVFTWELDGTLLLIRSDSDLFGPQPFLAIQENGRFFRDNTTAEGPRKWAYQFRRPEEVEAFGIAGNSPRGNTGLVVHYGGLKNI